MSSYMSADSVIPLPTDKPFVAPLIQDFPYMRLTPEQLAAAKDAAKNRGTSYRRKKTAATPPPKPEVDTTPIDPAQGKLQDKKKLPLPLVIGCCIALAVAAYYTFPKKES